jgi:diguanylate cyclase (GGDEF)-like protein
VTARARRHKFSIRVVLAMAASVACLLVASETFFTRAISHEFVEQNARSYGADARAFEQAYEEGSDPEDALDDVLDLIDSMEDRLGVVSAKLVDADMHVVTGPRDSILRGDRAANPQFRATRPDRNDFAGSTRSRRDGDHLDFVVPLVLAGNRFVLHIEQNSDELDAQVRALRNETLTFSMLALLLGMVLFYAIGGRSLARRHRTVVRRATRDPLTDLGNHRTFQEELTEAVASAGRRRESLALALVDLDDFKFVNDRHGHRRGDEVLAGMARVLEHGRSEDRAFRIGGDEFALLLPGADGERARMGVERRLVATRGAAAASSFTAGIAVLAPGRDDDPAVLWEQADAALYEGKRSGGGGVVVFDDVAELISLVTPAKVLALRSLLDEPRLEIAFQPIWQLQDSSMLGVEALARPWSGYGFDGPAEMFAVAEKIGRAHELDALCRAAALARTHELPEETLLFLNVNPQSLAHDTLRGDQLVRAVKASGLDPERVVLEITERSSARLDQVIADAARLRSLGFRLALDDVGAGNAGLEMLRELPVDFVKIDRSVIVAAVKDTQAQAVLVAIIAYARRADAFVIAEGIESVDILDFVRTVDSHDVMRDPPIDGGQGFLLGRPSVDPAQIAPLAEIRSGLRTVDT